MKQEICKAFCDSVEVAELPGGLGISSKLFSLYGDPAGIYAIGPDVHGLWRLDDGGWVLPNVIASGFDLEAENRQRALQSILDSASICLDTDALELYAANVRQQDLPATAIRFLAALVRVADLDQWTQDRVRSTFREDVKAGLAKLLPEIEIEENAVADERRADLRADLVLRAKDKPAVALYLAQQDIPLLEAMLLRSETASLSDRPLVAAILEKETAVTKRTRTRAVNRLDLVAIYQDDQAAALEHIASQAGSERIH